MNWLFKNLSLLAFILALAAAAFTLLSLFTVFGLYGRQSPVGPLSAIWLLVWVALKLVAIGVAYGLFLRLLGLCDDVAALRREKTGAGSGVSYPS